MADRGYNLNAIVTAIEAMGRTRDHPFKGLPQAALAVWQHPLEA